MIDFLLKMCDDMTYYKKKLGKKEVVDIELANRR